MKKTVKSNPRERGIALLFALGVLSLLLVLGLAFATNSLMARKVAANNSYRGQAKIMALSAINRVATAIAFYQQSEYIRSGGGFPVAFSSLYSYMERSGLGSSDTAGSDNESTVNDNLYKPGEEDHKSLLYSHILGGSIKDKENENADDATWIFVTAEETTTDAAGNSKDVDKIIGRYAYRVLPADIGSRLNLYALQGGYFYYDEPDSVNHNNNGKPWEYRIGRDSRELNLAEVAPFKNWPDSFTGGDAFVATEDQPSVSDMNLQDLDAYIDSNKTIFDTDELREWIKRWFEDGGIKSEYEAYRFEKTGEKRWNYLHRFNISKLFDGDKEVESWNTWLGVDKNTFNAVKKLTMEDVDAEETAAFELEDESTPDHLGIPFLKMIGDTRGTFKAIEDRRHQVAANLLDYVDDDDIPTSDVAASTWKDLAGVTESAQLPTFTGNERTAYINEIALGLQGNVKQIQESCDGCQAYTKAELQIVPELIVELIRIYKDALPATYFKTVLNSLKLRVAATITVGRIDYSYLDAEGNTLSASINLDKALDPKEDEVALGSALNVGFAVGSFDAAEGYKVGSGEIEKSDGSEALVPLSFSFSDAVKTAFDNASKLGTNQQITQVNVTSWKFVLKSASFELGNLILLDGEDGNGIDFVRWKQSENTKLDGEDFTLFTGFQVDGELGATDNTVFSLNATDNTREMKKSPYRYFYLAGMEAIDPRQNLNARDDEAGEAHTLDSVEKFDWTFANFGAVAYNNAGFPAGEGTTVSDPHLTMQITNDAAKEKPTFAGRVNSKSNPQLPYGSVTEAQELLYDGELATDPAWLGDDKAQHISTAYIRNNGMRSFWELGAIHRGVKWETINLSNALSRTGGETDLFAAKDHDPGYSISSTTSAIGYSRGDGGILDQVKMTDDVRSYGKVDLNALDEDYETDSVKFDATRDKEIGRMLFRNVKLGQEYEDLDTKTAYETNGTTLSSDDAGKIVDVLVTGDGTHRPFESRAALLGWEPGGKVFFDGYGLYLDTDEHYPNTDAAREELIGKTANLMTATAFPQRTIQAVVVAQTIKDVGRDGSSGSKLPMFRLKEDGKTMVEKEDTKLNRFDYVKDGDEFIYFDEITGEVKLLVTFLWDSFTGRLRIRQIEYLD